MVFYQFMVLGKLHVLPCTVFGQCLRTTFGTNEKRSLSGVEREYEKSRQKRRIGGCTVAVKTFQTILYIFLLEKRL